MSPRTKIQNEEIRETSKKKILDAALKLFAERGFDGTTISNVAKEAGVAKGLIYNYFSSKEELVHHIVLNGASEMEGVIAELMAQPTPSEKLRFIFNMIRDFMIERFEYQKLTSMMALKVDSFPELKEFAQAKYRGAIPMLSAILKEKGFENPDQEAALLAALTEGVSLQYMVLKDDTILNDTIDYLIQKYCD